MKVECTAPLTSVCYLTSGRHIAATSTNGDIFIYDVRRTRNPLSVKHTGRCILDISLKKIVSSFSSSSSSSSSAQSKLSTSNKLKRNEADRVVSSSSNHITDTHALHQYGGLHVGVTIMVCVCVCGA